MQPSGHPHYSQPKDDVQRPQVELIALPQEGEGAHDIAHGEERHSVGATEEHDGKGDPVGGEEDDHLHHVQVVSAEVMEGTVSIATHPSNTDSTAFFRSKKNKEWVSSKQAVEFLSQ